MTSRDLNTSMTKWPDRPLPSRQFKVGKYVCSRCDLVVIGDPLPLNHNNLCRCGQSLTFEGSYWLRATS